MARRREQDHSNYRFLVASPYESSRTRSSRTNSESRLSQLQYSTPRGNIPATVAAGSIRRDLENTRTRSGYPGEYRNNEGPAGDRHALFEGFQTGRGATLHEHPVRRPHEPHFEPLRNRPRLHQLENPIHPNDRGRVVRAPHNDPGPFRAVTSSSHNNLVGVTYHPTGDRRGFREATLEPIDRQGRQDAQRHRDRLLSQGASRLSSRSNNRRIGGMDTTSYTYSGSYPPR
ncbi:hypothetical protein FQN49_008307 [Arthroderma sp. PD_2]|nr:hypothetical protein FQN49_008307 [Arthroderma sp. PD_2]